MIRALAAALLALAAGSSATAPADAPFAPTAGRPAYALRLDRDVPPEGFARAFPGLATWGFYGAEPVLRRARQPMTAELRSTSRTWGGLLNMHVDADYCRGAPTPAVTGGELRITAYRFTPEAAARCGRGRRAWGSSIITSQPSFAQAFGYWEIEAKLPCDPGRWPAFWLLPVSKTPQNGGRLAEIDVFEHYGGSLTLISQGRPVVINRVGQPFSTLHSGVTGKEQAAGNAGKLPAISDAERAAFCAGWHRFGVDWTPAEFRFYVDGRETFRTPNPGVTDPHYWVVNLDISEHAGEVAKVSQPSIYRIRSIRVWHHAPAAGQASGG